MKWFQREPAAWAALAGVVVMVVGRFAGWSPDAQGAVNAVALAVLGVITAVVVGTRGDGLLALIVGLAKAALAALLAFKVHVSADDQVLIMTAVTMLGGFFLRTQLTAPVGPPGETGKS